jgi:hypothetical protein
MNFYCKGLTYLVGYEIVGAKNYLNLRPDYSGRIAQMNNYLEFILESPAKQAKKLCSIRLKKQ